MPSSTLNTYTSDDSTACLTVTSDNPRKSSETTCALFEVDILPKVKQHIWRRNDDEIITEIEGFEVSLVTLIGAEYGLYSRTRKDEDYTKANFCDRKAGFDIGKYAATHKKQTKAPLIRNKLLCDRMPRMRYKRSNLESCEFQIPIYTAATKQITVVTIKINKAHIHLVNTCCIYDKNRGLVGHSASGEPEFIDARIGKELGVKLGLTRLDLLDYRIDESNRFISRLALKHKYYKIEDDGEPVTLLEVIQVGHYEQFKSKRAAADSGYNEKPFNSTPNIFEWDESGCGAALVTSIFVAFPSEYDNEIRQYDWRFNRTTGNITAIKDDGVSKWNIDFKRTIADLADMNHKAVIVPSRMTANYKSALDAGEVALKRVSKYQNTRNQDKKTNNAMYTVSRSFQRRNITAEKLTFFCEAFGGIGVIALDLRPQALAIAKKRKA